jgi:hypothetical protein
MASSTTTKFANTKERNIVLGFSAVILGCIVLFSLFGPIHEGNDPQPTTYNSDSDGVKAAYLLASNLGYDAQRWNQDPQALRQVDAAKTTLVLTEPVVPVKSLKATQEAIADFLNRGGRVLATGASGATLLPNGKTDAVTTLAKSLCLAHPEGAGTLARAGKVSLSVPVRWSADGPEFRVEERCGNDAVVVRYPYGKGEAIWWSSPMPMSNAGIEDDASLALTLASLGPVATPDGRRTLLFDEYLHEERESIDDLVGGLPWTPMKWQAAVLGLLLVLSFGRRRGPVRLPVAVPRSSPVEFAESMGRLYQRATATEAPLDAARAQTLRFLAEVCGLSQETLRQPATVIAETLEARIGGDWGQLAEHLEAARHGEERAPTSKLALKLVQALEQDQRDLAAQVSAARSTVGQ